MHDPRIRRHDLESRERFLRPAQERVALAIALELEIGVDLERGRRAELIDDDRVVDDELGGEQRIHAFGIAAHLHHRVPHRGEIHDGGDAGEVLQQHARRHERDLFIRQPERLPTRQFLHVGGLDHATVFAAQQILEQDLEGIR